MFTAKLIFLVSMTIVAGDTSSIQCNSLTSCSECIATLSCIWCSNPGYAQCFSQQDTDKLLACEEVVDPQSSITINQLPLNDFHQVSIDSIQMKLRVGETQNFTVSVRSAENFPLDLYMLMDFSLSFGDDLESARDTAGDIVSALEKITSQFRVGFGKFTDKPTPPYTSYNTLDLAYMVFGEKSSCRYTPGVTFTPCGRPIPYEHVVTLTNSSMDFSSAIQALVIEISSDDPEGILDAMMQAVVCTDIVGWREEARKVLLVMTDDVAHTAGDGRLAAIHTPNDGQCHTHYNPQLNKIVHTGSLDYDYPSLEHMRLVLLEKGIVPVFAASSTGTAGLNNYYQQFANVTQGFYASLAEDSTNMVEVISEAIAKIVSNVKLVYNVPTFLTVSHKAECPTSTLKDTSCTNIGNQTANFTISITLNECPKQSFTSQVKFNFPGFGTFLVDVEGICECSCDQQSEQNSINCSGNGILTCGKCGCSDGWEGEDCSCSINPCPVGPNGKTCSGEGSCVCGQCQCDPVTASYAGVDEPMVFGSACECSNFRCDTDDKGVVCSGRGTCQCSEGMSYCECGVSTFTGLEHTGDHCQCSHDNCFNPDSSSSGECNGQGTCSPCSPRGAACSCNDSNFGNYCESAAFQLDPQCNFDDQTTQDCVTCFGQAVSENVNPEDVCPSMYSSCLSANFMIQDEDSGDDYAEYETAMCSIPASIECDYHYFVAVNSSGSSIYVVEAKKCLLLPVWVIILIILVGLIITGIAILFLAKGFVRYLDYREVKKFKKELRSGNVTEHNNPMYQKPATTYENVMYEKDSGDDIKENLKLAGGDTA